MTDAAGSALYGAGFLEAFGIHAQTRAVYLVILILAIVLATGLAVSGIKLSTRFGLILEIFSLAAIPRAVLFSSIIVGLMYIFSAYVSVKGLGVTALAKSADPMNDSRRPHG